jgi:transcriptional regulator with XRE-family HTH domain
MSHATERVKEPDSDKYLSHSPARLRYRREAAGLTLRELAARAKCSAGSLSLYENGKVSPNPRTLLRLAAALDCATTDLMPDEPKGSAA